MAAFLPFPVFAIRAICEQVAATSVALGSLTQLLLEDLKNQSLQTPHFVEGTFNSHARTHTHKHTRARTVSYLHLTFSIVVRYGANGIIGRGVMLT